MLSFIDQISEEFSEILLIKGENVSNYYTCNALLIKDSLIDTGISINFLRKVIKKYKIKTVIFSHWHEDHISGSHLLKDCDFLCHYNDKSIIENINYMYKLYGYESNPPKELVHYLSEYSLKDTRISETVENNEIIEIENDLRLKVIHTPGHTSGHCCFYEENSKFAFLSDIAMPGSGPWYGGLDSSLLEYEQSLGVIKNLDIKIAALSHFGVISDIKELKRIINEQESIIQTRDERILSNISENKPTTSEDLWKKNLIYEGAAEYEQPLILSEKIMIEKHFEKLVSKGVIKAENNGFILS